MIGCSLQKRGCDSLEFEEVGWGDMFYQRSRVGVVTLQYEITIRRVVTREVLV